MVNVGCPRVVVVCVCEVQVLVVQVLEVPVLVVRVLVIVVIVDEVNVVEVAVVAVMVVAEFVNVNVVPVVVAVVTVVVVMLAVVIVSVVKVSVVKLDVVGWSLSSTVQVPHDTAHLCNRKDSLRLHSSAANALPFAGHCRAKSVVAANFSTPSLPQSNFLTFTELASQYLPQLRVRALNEWHLPFLPFIILLWAVVLWGYISFIFWRL